MLQDLTSGSQGLAPLELISLCTSLQAIRCCSSLHQRHPKQLFLSTSRSRQGVRWCRRTHLCWIDDSLVIPFTRTVKSMAPGAQTVTSCFQRSPSIPMHVISGAGDARPKPWSPCHDVWNSDLCTCNRFSSCTPWIIKHCLPGAHNTDACISSAWAMQISRMQSPRLYRLRLSQSIQTFLYCIARPMRRLSHISDISRFSANLYCRIFILCFCRYLNGCVRAAPQTHDVIRMHIPWKSYKKTGWGLGVDDAKSNASEPANTAAG